MPDPHNEPSHSGSLGPGTVHESGAGAFEEIGLTAEELDRRARNRPTRRKAMGPLPPARDDDAVGAFADDVAEPRRVAETTPD
jgi:hypothetical protein